MSILQLLLVLIVLPGFYRVYSGLSGFLARHPRLGLANNAKKIAFTVVAVIAALIAAPTLTLGLPAIFRLATTGLYVLVVIYGATYIWDFVSSRGRNASSK